MRISKARKEAGGRGKVREEETYVMRPLDSRQQRTRRAVVPPREEEVVAQHGVICPRPPLLHLCLRSMSDIKIGGGSVFAGGGSLRDGRGGEDGRGGGSFNVYRDILLVYLDRGFVAVFLDDIDLCQGGRFDGCKFYVWSGKR